MAAGILRTTGEEGLCAESDPRLYRIKLWGSWTIGAHHWVLTADQSVNWCIVRIYLHCWRALSLLWVTSASSRTHRACLFNRTCFWLNVVAFCRLVGGLLTLSLDYCFVLEDEDGICGYALGTVDVTPFIKKCKMSWIPFMQEKYTKPNSDKELSEAEVGITVRLGLNAELRSSFSQRQSFVFLWI